MLRPWRVSPTIGNHKFEIEDDTATLSYSIDKSYRGKGLGKLILSLGNEHLKKDVPSIKTILGYVKSQNTASNKVFHRLGFQVKSFDDMASETYQ